MVFDRIHQSKSYARDYNYTEILIQCGTDDFQFNRVSWKWPAPSNEQT